MPGSMFPFGKDSEDKKEKREPDGQDIMNVIMNLFMCVLINCQFENKDGKNLLLLLLVSHQKESLNVWSKIITEFHVM